MPTVITTLAGGGRRHPADGEVATEVRLKHPSGVIFDLDGSVILADSNLNAVRRVHLDGTLSTIAGDHGPGYAGDGGPAVDASLRLPTMVVLAADGSLLVADRDNDAIRRIDPDGTIRTIAGGHGPGNSGDGGPAVDAQLDKPRGLALGDDGSLFLTDRDNHTIRRIDPDGTITTVVGGGFGYSGDGGPALAATLKRPRGLSFGPDGALYIADRNNHAIRRIDPDGTISTFAGGCGRGYSGDGGPATEATFDHPSGIVFAADGTAYVSDHLNHAIRRIDRDGTIGTVVGGNGPGYRGDGGDPLDAQLTYPSGLALAVDGTMVIADRNNEVVRRVTGITGDEPCAVRSAPPPTDPPPPPTPVPERPTRPAPTPSAADGETTRRRRWWRRG